MFNILLLKYFNKQLKIILRSVSELSSIIGLVCLVIFELKNQKKIMKLLKHFTSK